MGKKPAVELVRNPGLSVGGGPSSGGVNMTASVLVCSKCEGQGSGCVTMSMSLRLAVVLCMAAFATQTLLTYLREALCEIPTQPSTSLSRSKARLSF